MLICRYLVFVLALCSLPFIARAQISLPPEIIPKADLATRPNFSGNIYEAYPNGMPKVWKTLVDGVSNGDWAEWYPDGTIRFRASWAAGKMHGVCHYYYPDGQVRETSTYEMDVMHGIARSYHPNGQLEASTPYRNGKIYGMVHRWSTDGTPLESQRYNSGKRVIDRPARFEAGKVASAVANEWDITFTPGGDSLYFYRRQPEAKDGGIYFSSWNGKRWSDPIEATPDWPEARSIFITYDGQRSFTTSYQPLPGQTSALAFDSNIWLRERRKDGWSAPVSVGNVVNQKMEADDPWPLHYEAGHSTDSEGNLYYWAGEETGNASDLYLAPLLADGTFGAGQRLPDAVNSAGFESSPMISPDGKYLFFAAAGRGDGYGNEDIYYSRKVAGKWTTARNLGPAINSMGNDSFPSFSPDGKYFFFSSDRDGKSDDGVDPIWSIYYLESSFLSVE